jgi:hypothetical protein
MRGRGRSYHAFAPASKRELSKMKSRSFTRSLKPLLLGLVAIFLLVAPASALGAPVLDVSVDHHDITIPADGYGRYDIAVSNSGNEPTSGLVTVSFTIPAIPPGLKVTQVTSEPVPGFFGGPETRWVCSLAPDSQSGSCTGPSSFGFPSPIETGKEACQSSFSSSTCRIIVVVKAEAGLAPTTLTPTVQASGGAADPASASDPTQVGGPPPDFHLTSLSGGAFDQLGDDETRAGAHPYQASVSSFFSTVLRPTGEEYVTEALKDAIADLPPGFIGNPQAAEKCTVTDLLGERGPLQPSRCPNESQVGVLTVWENGFTTGPFPVPGEPLPADFPIYNMVSPKGTAAVLGTNVSGAMVAVAATVVPDGAGYAVRTTSLNAPIVVPFSGITFTIWGVPADPSHNPDRLCTGTNNHGCGSNDPAKAFLSMPTSCTGPAQTHLAVTSWQGSSDSGSFESPGNTACADLDFSPTLQARPTTHAPDSPSGLDVDLHIPQDTFGDPDNTVSAHLKEATVTLPKGMTVNPSGANGLDGCSPAEIGLGAEGAAQCPDASKLGTVEVDTPVLDHPVPGAVYIADPFDNPFNSLLALYIAVDDPVSGVVVKLAGEVEANPVNGQLTTSFRDNPQLPFEDVRLHFFGGAGGSLRTPAVCGPYTTTSSMTPWSAPETGPPDTPSDTWTIEQPGGGCPTSEAAIPNAASFDAGTVSPIAAARTPLIVNLRRQDGSQQFKSLTLTPPQGLVGKLAGIPICPESALAEAAAKSGKAEEASSSCPVASYVGSVMAAAGAGPAPYHAPGRAYLTGPYKGAPLSLAIVTPATAGPFDLGTIVVRTALYVDRKTAQITAVSDPIPSILQGIPLDVRSVEVKMDRPDFIINPTSCDPMAFGGQLLSTFGQTLSLQSHFQLGECGRLGFKPKMSLSLKGGTARGKYPALTAVLKPRPGDANLADISVALPHSEFLAQEHIRTICTRVQFAADQCPPGAIYGTATVTTPLLDYPLTGPVYLRSSDNPLPDLVPDLRGPAYQPIKLESAGRTDSIRGGIRNSFDFVPDAAFTKLVLQMQGGKKGLLVNSRNICKRKNRVTVKMGAHNGATFEARPVLRADCPKKAAKRKRPGG